MNTLPDRLTEDPALLLKLQNAGNRIKLAIGKGDSAEYYAALLDVYEQGEGRGERDRV